MTKTIKLIVCVFITILMFSCKTKNTKCIIKGRVHGVKTESLILLKNGESFSHDGIDIPVKDSVFEYETDLNYCEGAFFMLGKARNRGGITMHFMLEPGEIEVDLYPKERMKLIKVKGGKHNDEVAEYNTKRLIMYNKYKYLIDSINLLYKHDKYLSKEAKDIYKLLREEKDFSKKKVLYKKIDTLKKSNRFMTPVAKRLSDKNKTLYTKNIKDEFNATLNTPTIFSYYNILKYAGNSREFVSVDDLKKLHKVVTKEFKGHPYNSVLNKIIASMEKIKVGGEYIDFTAPDKDGNMVKLSDQIKGKVSVIDLWSSWCGPCISSSKSLVPIYNEFKDSGFTVVSVAGEFKNTKRMEAIIEKEKFPWLNLIELDKRADIWQIYGIPNSGGAVFLVDKKGKILARNPSADEVRKKLKELL